MEQTQRPIIVIDDDEDDIELIHEAFRHLAITNEVLSFNNPINALEFLTNTTKPPMFILCDINMNTMSGLELRQSLYENARLRVKTIPFLFYSTSGASPLINKAFEMCVQGYFVKPNNFGEMCEQVKRIYEYWSIGYHPNKKYPLNNKV